MSYRMPVTTRNMLCEQFDAMRMDGASFRDIGREYKISSGVAFRILNSDYEPKDSAIRQRLGLPIFAPAAVCAKHGIVHVTRRCPSDKPRASRPKRGRWRDGNWNAKS